jgi:hypothetical protein
VIDYLNDVVLHRWEEKVLEGQLCKVLDRDFHKNVIVVARLYTENKVKVEKSGVFTTVWISVFFQEVNQIIKCCMVKSLYIFDQYNHETLMLLILK